MRKTKTRRTNKIKNGIIVLVEGKTEEQFIKNFEKEIAGKSIFQIFEINANNPEEIVKTIEAQKVRIKSGEIWLVIDTEGNTNFDKSLNLFINAGAQVAWSNPCFEVALFEFLNNKPRSTTSTVNSYLTSFKNSFKSETGKDYIKSNKDNFKYLNAITNYQVVINRLKSKHKNALLTYNKTADMNGISTIYKLLERLIELN